MLVSKDMRNQTYINQARDRGWVSLEELLHLAACSPIDLEEATELVRESGIELVEGTSDPWDDLERLADEGRHAFVSPALPTPAEELAPDSAAALYLREISQRPLLTAEEEVMLAKQREAGEEAKPRVGDERLKPEARQHLEEVI